MTTFCNLCQATYTLTSVEPKIVIPCTYGDMNESKIFILFAYQGRVDTFDAEVLFVGLVDLFVFVELLLEVCVGKVQHHRLGEEAGGGARVHGGSLQRVCGDCKQTKININNGSEQTCSRNALDASTSPFSESDLELSCRYTAASCQMLGWWPRHNRAFVEIGVEKVLIC